MGAQCGAMEISAKHGHDVTIQFKTDMEELIVLSADAELNANNWVIGSPASIRTSGFGVTKSRVAAGLESGLRSNFDSIQTMLIDESPNILFQAKDRILAAMRPQPNTVVGATKEEALTPAMIDAPVYNSLIVNSGPESRVRAENALSDEQQPIESERPSESTLSEFTSTDHSTPEVPTPENLQVQSRETPSPTSRESRNELRHPRISELPPEPFVRRGPLRTMLRNTLTWIALLP